MKQLSTKEREMVDAAEEWESCLEPGGRTALSDLIKIAREYPGVTGEMVDAMIKRASERGVIEVLRRHKHLSWDESPSLLLPVIIHTAENPQETFTRGIRLIDAIEVAVFGEIKLLPGVEFSQNDLCLLFMKVEIVRRNSNQAVTSEEVFAPLFLRSQHPEWFHRHHQHIQFPLEGIKCQGGQQPYIACQSDLFTRLFVAEKGRVSRHWGSIPGRYTVGRLVTQVD